VHALGRDLAVIPGIQQWIVDIVSPGLLRMLQEQMGDVVKQAGAPYLFAPAEGPVFFEACGWTPVAVRSMLKTARKLNRLPLFLRMIAMLPESNGPQGSRPWSAVCLLEKSQTQTATPTSAATRNPPD
jgi:hypothetical protein